LTHVVTQTFTPVLLTVQVFVTCPACVHLRKCSYVSGLLQLYEMSLMFKSIANTQARFYVGQLSHCPLPNLSPFLQIFGYSSSVQ